MQNPKISPLRVKSTVIKFIAEYTIISSNPSNISDISVLKNNPLIAIYI